MSLTCADVVQTAARLSDKSEAFDPTIGFLDKRILAKLLDLSPTTIDRLRDKKVIPSYKIAGGAVRFRYTEVLKALERYRVKEATL